MSLLEEAYSGEMMSLDVELMNGKHIKVRKADLKFLRIQTKDDIYTYYSDKYKLFIRVPANRSKIYGYTKQELEQTDFDYLVEYII